MFSFNTPWNHKKPLDFLMISGGIEREHREETGYAVVISKLKRTNSQNWYISKGAIQDSFTSRSLFVINVT